ncbi:Alpha-methylacyl-CoA racemase [Enhygromyxa salina]|uniref:Alpha-methylacyl-CoA racemase n=1 Tax=Enhygromyxa salina TaxID=215803 RepID=A0A0C2CU51_9BACT|nr:CaiB/BaiF CoA-transferase family protein [Enhygromyxa salina]KIG14681.1 Alpha-methylacyl-CoA racemase [Enhygromyxa salina]
MSESAGALAGTLVVDCTRMLPGAVLARSLIDLGARLIKIEDRHGDMMRHAPPLVGGIGVGFCVYYRGAESLRLDLRTPQGLARLRRLLHRADVFLESFRPGTLQGWGLDLDQLQRECPRLISCSLPGYADDDRRVAHDLNLTGLTGLLGQLPGSRLTHGGGEDIPRVLVADINTGLLATSSVLAALVGRATTGRGAKLNQPLLSGSLPLLTWPWADRAAGGDGVLETVLAGRVPCYRCYRCGDGKLLSVGCLEPKFWQGLCQAIGRPELASAGLDLGERGRAAADAVAELFATQPRSQWLATFANKDLPVAAVHDLDDARSEPIIASAGLLEHTPMPGGGVLTVPGPALPSIGRTPARAAPRLGEHDDAILRELEAEPNQAQP